MAQIPNSLRARKSIIRWAELALPGARQTSKTLAYRARPKIGGLGLGDRRLLQALGDCLVVIGGALSILVLSERAYSLDTVVVSIAVLSALWFFFAGAFDAYKVPVMQNKFRSGYAAAQALITSMVTYILVAWLVGGTLPIIRPRISETAEIIALVVPLFVARSLFSMVLSHAPLRRKVVVLGANRTGYEIIEAIKRYDGRTYQFLGYFDDSPESGEMQSIERVRPSAELVAVHREVGIDQIVLANPVQTGPLLHTLALLHERGVQVTPMFALYQDLTGRVPVSHLGADCYVALPAHVKSVTRTYRVIKRALDLALALLALAITAPLIPLIALAIKLDSPGPIFFKQTRVGRGGKPFRIVKFRSMRQDAEAITGAVWARDGDSRITRVGRLMRKSRLDEIPQLWNVLVGDMSFVGPRPERPEFDEELEREIPFYRARRAVRPGLTGWAQVNYGYGSTMLDALRKVEYDLYYIKNESLYLDLVILLRTIAVVFKLGGT